MSKTLKHDLKVDALLDTGMELIWSKGYNATSVNDIVKAASIPKGSFYFYFESKEDFVVRAIEKYFEQHFYPALKILQNQTVSPKQRLLDFYDFRTEVLKEELKYKMGCMCCNLASEMAEHSEEIRRILASKGELVKGHLAEVIKEAQLLNEIDDTIDARNLAEFIEDAGKGAMITMKEMNSPYPIDNFARMVRKLLLR